MRRNIQTMVNTIELMFQNIIMSKDENFIQSGIYRLNHLEKQTSYNIKISKEV